MIEDVDFVVLGTKPRAEDALYRALKGRVARIHRIGDCLRHAAQAGGDWTKAEYHFRREQAYNVAREREQEIEQKLATPGHP